MYFERLCDSFLAAFPVIGPHADIEAELLLAGKKPIGGPYPLFGSAGLPAGCGMSIIKAELDRIRLDAAVSAGALRSVDVKDGPAHFRYFCQPDELEALKAALEKNGLYGEQFGYRERDIKFFEWYARLPDWLGTPIRKINAPMQSAYQNKCLREAGISEPNTYFQGVLEHIEQFDMERNAPRAP